MLALNLHGAYMGNVLQNFLISCRLVYEFSFFMHFLVYFYLRPLT